MGRSGGAARSTTVSAHRTEESLTSPGGPRQGLAAERLSSDSFSEIWELLGGVTLDQDVPVIQGVEINLDDIGTGVVDPHDIERMTAH